MAFKVRLYLLLQVSGNAGSYPKGSLGFRSSIFRGLGLAGQGWLYSNKV